MTSVWFLLCLGAGIGQTLSPRQASLVAVDVRTVLVPAGSAATFLSFTVDPSTHGGDAFDIVSDNSQITVSLIVPGSSEITALNASSFGIQWSAFTSSGVDIAGVSPFDEQGNHILIVLPAGSQPGTYQVKANASATTVDSALTVTYHSSSSVHAGLATNKAFYRAADTVVFSGLIFDNVTPLNGAIAAVEVGGMVDISSQSIVGNYTLVGQTAVDSSNSIFTYSASLINSGSSIQVASASLRNQTATLSIIDGTLAFASVPANGSSASLKTFAIQLPTVNQFNPSTLSWSVNSVQPSTQITLADSGQFDAATGDGIYTGTFVPPGPGIYSATITATGTSLSGLSFSRKASTTFRVDPSTANFTSFQDQVFDDDGNGLFDRLVTTATVNVQTPGNYLFAVQLQASNGNTLSAKIQAALTVGTSQVAVTFTADDIIRTLGVDGPYTRRSAALVYLSQGADIAADTRDNAGTTAAYSLASFDRGPVYFTGQNSAIGVDTTGSGFFDILRVQIGIHNTAGGCNWSGSLADSIGTVLSYVGGSLPSVPAGNNSLTFDFNGNLIAQSGKDGPYQVQDVGITCGVYDLLMAQPVPITGFTAAQFHFVPQSITALVSPTGG
jgi:hypothetical protein